MSATHLPWSYYAVIVTFGVFFFSVNVYILTLVFAHPFASPWWIVVSLIGLLGLAYSIRMVRVHQRMLIEDKHAQEKEE